MELNCCVANGPRGLMLLPAVAVMTGPHGPVVNLYSAGRWSGDSCDLEITTAYLYEAGVEIAVTPKQADTFSLRLRIPAWSEQTSLAVNGTRVRDVRPGTYAVLERRWKPGDRVRLQLDLRGRVRRSGPFAAVARGPLVLARDLRLGQVRIDDPVRWEVPVRGMPLESIPPPPGVTAAFRIPGRTSDRTADDVRLCDYASAGNTWDASSRYRVWMPVA